MSDCGFIIANPQLTVYTGIAQLIRKIDKMIRAPAYAEAPYLKNLFSLFRKDYLVAFQFSY